ncbi:chemotaxis protein CheB [candidate division KSB1 bacterium]|nr:chemotaxis protein CheB [candidate division KSB1 bacterium]
MDVKKLVIIGSSAGGPRILKELFDGLPRLNGVIIIVQHMPKFINESLCDTINEYTQMDVRLVEDGIPLENHSIYIAPSEKHIKLISDESFQLFDGERNNYVKPSIDVVMQSIEENKFEQLMGIILTGMGRDGAEGIKYLKTLNAVTIAQSEKTCAIFGMPSEAINTGCIDLILDPLQIREKIISTLRVNERF